MNWITALVSLGSSLLVGIGTALITTRLALRRFHSEKWWERKTAAYAAIIESMHHIREHADTLGEVELRDRKLAPERKELLDRNLREAIGDLRKHRDIGSFVISEQAINVLDGLFGELEKAAAHLDQGSLFEYFDERAAALDRALKKMRQVAKSDLSLS